MSKEVLVVEFMRKRYTGTPEEIISKISKSGVFVIGTEQEWMEAVAEAVTWVSIDTDNSRRFIASAQEAGVLKVVGSSIQEEPDATPYHEL